MRFAIQDRRLGRIWPIAFVLLAACVFLWGLEYKISLYFPPQATVRQIPTAKLLSKNEQKTVPAELAAKEPGRASHGLIQSAPGLHPGLPAFVFFAFAATLSAAVRRVGARIEPVRIFDPLTASAIFVRPPPARF